MFRPGPTLTIIFRSGALTPHPDLSTLASFFLFSPYCLAVYTVELVLLLSPIHIINCMKRNFVSLLYSPGLAKSSFLKIIKQMNGECW